jgi:multiple sugar transport system ATP-binding protein
MMTGLELTSISKSFGANRVLDDVSLSVAPGEFVSLVGPSGCGKSTLLRIIAGLEAQDGGQVRIGSAIVDHLGPRARNIAMVFQSYALYPHMSAFQNIALPLSVARLSLPERLPLLRHLSPRGRRVRREIAAQVADVAGQLQIEPLLGRKPGQLSGGQRQRVALARAMVRNPTLFLMDEPLSNLDAQLRVHMRDELASLHRKLGATFIYVTHDQVEAMTMSTRVAMMDRGRLAQVGVPRELYDRPATLSVARFIGSPTINVLPGRIDPSGMVVIDGRPLPLRVAAEPGARVDVGIRPEALRLVPADGAAGEVVLTGHVRREEHHGAERLVYVVPHGQETASGPALIVRIAATDPSSQVPEFSAGAVVGIACDVARLHVFDAGGLRIDAQALPRGVRASAVAAPMAMAGSW